MNYVLFSRVSDTHGFAVEKVGRQYQVVYVKHSEDKDGKVSFVKVSASRSNGKLHSYTSPFLAGHAIRKEILPLYKETK